MSLEADLSLEPSKELLEGLLSKVEFLDRVDEQDAWSWRFQQALEGAPLVRVQVHLR